MECGKLIGVMVDEEADINNVEIPKEEVEETT